MITLNQIQQYNHTNPLRAVDLERDCLPDGETYHEPEIADSQTDDRRLPEFTSDGDRLYTGDFVKYLDEPQIKVFQGATYDDDGFLLTDLPEQSCYKAGDARLIQPSPIDFADFEPDGDELSGELNGDDTEPLEQFDHIPF